MDNYIIKYNPFNNNVFADYPQVQANSYIEAARKFIDGRFANIKRSGDRDVNLAILRGEIIDDHTIGANGNQQWYKCTN